MIIITSCGFSTFSVSFLIYNMNHMAFHSWQQSDKPGKETADEAEIFSQRYPKISAVEADDDMKKFMNSTQMLQAMADNNVKVNYAIAIILILTSLIGFTGLLIIKEDTAIFQQVPSILVYIGLFILNAAHLLRLIRLRTASTRHEATHILDICYYNFLLNAVFSGLTLFSTQQGSSLFLNLF